MKRIKDSCTLFPDGDYADCCESNDYSYASGVRGKVVPDLELALCVAQRGTQYWLL